MTPTRRQDKPGDRERQQKLRDRRKADGWRRVSIWLSPEQVERLEQHGGDEWLGRTVKRLLAWADPDLGTDNPLDNGARIANHATVAVPEPAPTVSDTRPAPVAALSDTTGDFSGAIKKAAFMTPEAKAALMAEVDSLLARGLSSHAIARKFNAEGRRTVRGALFYGPKLLREWRKWKGEG